MSKRMKILVVDDEADIRASLREILEEEGADTVLAESAAAALAQARAGVDLALVDIKLGADNGIDLLAELKREWPHLPVVMISGHGTVALAAQAFKLGAYDFLEKPLRLVQVRTCVRNALAKVRLKQQLAQQIAGGHAPVYVSEAMRTLFAQAYKLAHVRQPVLVLGPSGSGKELVARALHFDGDRATGPFVATNAATLPVNLAEDELFGHVKGAFTGADRERTGCLEQADNGTLFLDEIADLDPAIQAKLLRVLENGTFTRLGSTTPVKADVRFVCATHRNLEELVRQGKFREDLWYRISAFMLRVPSLQERPDDIPLLADYFLAIVCADMGIIKKFSLPALQALTRREYPGNVRELKHVVARLAVYAAAETITADEVNGPAVTAAPSLSLSGGGGGLGEFLALDFKTAREKFEKDYLAAVLARAGNSITAAANAIGMAQSNLSRKLKELGLR
jgi:two-component system nitrogen regulation response regulator NtrX